MTRIKQIIIVALCFTFTAQADFTVVVTPGFQFPTDPTTAAGLMTLDNLNLLGQPTVQVSGTLDGTTGLTPGTVDGSLLADSLPDGTNLVYNGNSPRQLTLSQTIAGPGLTGGGGNPLSIVFDSSKFQVVNDTLGLTNAAIASTNLQPDCVSLPNITNQPPFTLMGATNAPGNVTAIAVGAGLQVQTNGVSRPTLVVTNNGNFYQVFTNAPTSLATGLLVSTAHGLPGEPQIVQWFLINVTAELGYAQGDKIEICAANNNSSTAFAGGCNANNVFLSCSDSSPHIPNKSTGSTSGLTTADWKVICRAIYFK